MKNKHLIYGRHPILEAVAANQQFEKIVVQRGISFEALSEVKKYARSTDTPIQSVPVQKMNSLVKGNHQGIIGFLALVDYYTVEDILMKNYDDGVTPLFVLLDGVTDVRNIGAIARSAAATGASALVVPGKGSAYLGPDAMKASAGTLNHIPICRSFQISDAVEYLKLNGIPIFLSESGAEKMVYELELNQPVAIVFGDEGSGISTQVRQQADGVFSIPMSGPVESYNVSVSAGIVLYEALKQRQLHKK